MCTGVAPLQFVQSSWQVSQRNKFSVSDSSDSYKKMLDLIVAGLIFTLSLPTSMLLIFSVVLTSSVCLSTSEGVFIMVFVRSFWTPAVIPRLCFTQLIWIKVIPRLIVGTDGTRLAFVTVFHVLALAIVSWWYWKATKTARHYNIMSYNLMPDFKSLYPLVHIYFLGRFLGMVTRRPELLTRWIDLIEILQLKTSSVYSLLNFCKVIPSN